MRLFDEETFMAVNKETLYTEYMRYLDSSRELLLEGGFTPLTQQQIADRLFLLPVDKHNVFPDVVWGRHYIRLGTSVSKQHQHI